MQPYDEFTNPAAFNIPSILLLLSIVFQQWPLSGAATEQFKEFMVDHLKATKLSAPNTSDKKIGLLPTPPFAPQLQNVRKGDSNSLTPGDDRVFFPPYKYPFWGFPYGIYSKGGFFNPGLFPFVPGGPAFPPYDGIFGGPFGPGKFPGPGPTPFQGGSNATRSSYDYQNSYYPPERPPKRYKKKKYKKKCCTTTTTTTPAPPPTSDTPPPDTTTSTTAAPYMYDMDGGYRGSGYRKYPPPRYNRNNYGYHSYDYPPPPPQPAYGGQMPYPLIIQTPMVIPQQQPQYIMAPPQLPNIYNPYGFQPPPLQNPYAPNPYAPNPYTPNPSPYGTNPNQQPITVHNFFAPPNQHPPPYYQQHPYHPPPMNPYMGMGMQMPMQMPMPYPFYATTIAPPPEYVTQPTTSTTTEATTQAPPTTTPYTTTPIPPMTTDASTTTTTTTRYAHAPIIYYIQATPAPYLPPPAPTTEKYFDTRMNTYSYWYSTPSPTTQPPTTLPTAPPATTSPYISYYGGYGHAIQYETPSRKPMYTIVNISNPPPTSTPPSTTSPPPSPPLSTTSAPPDLYEHESYEYGSEYEPYSEPTPSASQQISVSRSVSYSKSRDGRPFSR